MTAKETPSATMKSATLLLELFVVAVVVALLVTVAAGTLEMRAIAVGVVVPIVALSLAFVHYSRIGRAWGYAGGSVLGALGVALRLAVSTRPSLEVGGGLPPAVTVLYVVLGSLVAVLNFAAALELRAARP